MTGWSENDGVERESPGGAGMTRWERTRSPLPILRAPRQRHPREGGDPLSGQLGRIGRCIRHKVKMGSCLRAHKKARASAQAFVFGSATRTRTWDPMINSHLLYQLSYRGSDAAYFIKKFIKVNALKLPDEKVRSLRLSCRLSVRLPWSWRRGRCCWYSARPHRSVRYPRHRSQTLPPGVPPGPWSDRSRRTCRAGAR